MRKKIIIPILILAIFVMLTGCKKKEEPVDATPLPTPVEEPVVEATEDEKEDIMKEFADLIKEKISPEVLITHVNNNIKKLSQIEGDLMVDELERKLQSNIEDLTNKIFATDKDDELIAIAGTEKYFPENKLGEIKNKELKEEMEKSFANMYKFINLEGEFYPIIDYAMFSKYDDNISDEWKEYFQIMAMDSENAPMADGGLTITFEELAERIIKTENHLNKYIGGKRQDQLTELYGNKLNAYMKGLPNTPIADYGNKQIFVEILESYEDTAAKEGYITAFMLNQYVEDIKANKMVIDNNILSKADEYIQEALRMLKEYK